MRKEFYEGRALSPLGEKRAIILRQPKQLRIQAQL